MKKIDIHLHVSLDPVPKTESMFISSGEEMLHHLDALGIEKAILMSAGEDPALPFGNTQCHTLAKRYPDRYTWMCNIDAAEPETIGARLRQYQAQGAVGIGELIINQRLDAPLLRQVFEAAQALQMPVLFHMSPAEGYGYGIVDEAGLPLLEAALKTYPDLKIIGHSQPFWHEISGDAKPDLESRMEWGKGPVAENGRLVELLRSYPNLYADVSANSGGCAIMRDEAFGLGFLEEFQDRLMFGTDMVNVEMTFPLGAWLDHQWEQGNLSGEAYQKICFENAKRIFCL